LPIYEYRCANGHLYDKAEGFDAPTRQKCPSCGARAQRQISVPAVVFKGSGFYSTDNRKGYASGNGGSVSSSSEDSKKSETKETAAAD
jgi:putative FmdB family regulatory protein